MEISQITTNQNPLKTRIFLLALDTLVYGRLDIYVSDAGQLNFPTAGILSFHCSCVVSNRQGPPTV